VPAYVIAHDATLLAVVEARPDSLAELGRVRGMGPARLARYGPEMLAVLGKS
jgi:superfamily II DNA helicase RecQ